MTFPRARLAVAACLLVAWLSYLGFLVYETRDAVVLSRPQFMVAQIYAVVAVSSNEGQGGKRPAAEVTIDEVLWSANPADRTLAGQVVHLPGLAECGKANGYRGAGKYLVPLNHSSNGYLIAPLPQREIRIYSWTPEAQAQLQIFIDAKK